VIFELTLFLISFMSIDEFLRDLLEGDLLRGEEKHVSFRMLVPEISYEYVEESRKEYFPPYVARRAIRRLTKRGDIVLDPLAFSGTVAMEAYSHGRIALVRPLEPSLEIFIRANLINQREVLWTDVYRGIISLKASTKKHVPGCTLENVYDPKTFEELKRLWGGVSELPEKIKYVITAALLRVSRNTSVKDPLKEVEREARRIYERAASFASSIRYRGSIEITYKRGEIGSLAITALPKRGIVRGRYLELCRLGYSEEDIGRMAHSEPPEDEEGYVEYVLKALKDYESERVALYGGDHISIIRSMRDRLERLGRRHLGTLIDEKYGALLVISRRLFDASYGLIYHPLNTLR